MAASTRSASSPIAIRSVEPTLKTSPETERSSMSPFKARIVSATWQKHRVCLPSPWISSGSSFSAFWTKRGMTIPYWPLCRGPTVLKSRTITQSRSRSWWYPSTPPPRDRPAVQHRRPAGNSGQQWMVIPRFVEKALKDEPLEIHGDGMENWRFRHVADTIPAP